MTVQDRNKALVLEGLDALFNKRDFAKAGDMWSPDYVQHSALVPAGREGLFGLVRSLPEGSRHEHGLIMAEGDFVMVHSRYSSPGRNVLIGVDIMRLKDGIFVEHWDVLQEEADAAASAGGHPMFGDAFPD